MTKFKNTLFNYSVSVAATLIIIELLVRNLIFFPALLIVTEKEGSYFSPESKLRWGAEGFINETADENGFNNDGFLGQKPVVCMMGDSYTEALQVERNNNYVSLLNKFFDEKSLFYNLGMSGQSIAHYISYANWYEKEFDCFLNVMFCSIK
jgi:hypothetical protein